MGGRGKWSIKKEDGFTWYDYHKVYQVGNTHFLVQHDHDEGGVSGPVMSKTPNVTYVTLDKVGRPKCISIYKNRVKKYEIDLDKPHHGILPRIHHCKFDGYRKKEKDGDMILSKRNRRKVARIMTMYIEYKKGEEK